MLVREDVAVRRDDDAGAGAAARASGIVRAPADVDADDRRADVLDRADDRARIGIERFQRLGCARARSLARDIDGSRSMIGEAWGSRPAN